MIATRSRLIAAALAGGVSLAVAAPATADFRQIYNDFANDGHLNACSYTDGQLADGANGIPPDIAQYAPSFADQINSAREQRAAGACTGGGSGGASQAEVAAAEAAAAAAGRDGGGGGGRSGPIPDPPTPSLPERAVVAGGVPAPAAPAIPAAEAASGAGAGWLVTLLGAFGLGGVALVRTRRRHRLEGALRRTG